MYIIIIIIKQKHTILGPESSRVYVHDILISQMRKLDELQRDKVLEIRAFP